MLLRDASRDFPLGEERHGNMHVGMKVRKMVTAEDISNQVLFICSPAVASTSGQSLAVCGNVEHLG